MKKSKGFTLIELLVVIAIIALLLSIIMPALGLAKEKAKNISCRANVRSMSLAFRMYTEQSDGKVFRYGSVSKLYLDYLADQLGDVDKVRYCPSTKIDETRGWGAGSSKYAWRWTGDEYGSYSFNGWLYEGDEADTIRWGVPDNTIIVNSAEYKAKVFLNSLAARNSASVPVFCDARWPDVWPQHMDGIPGDFNLEEGGNGSDNAPTDHMQRIVLDRHKGGINVSFLDGHVENIKLARLWSLKWNKKFEIFSNDKLRRDDSPIYKK